MTASDLLGATIVGAGDDEHDAGRRARFRAVYEQNHRSLLGYASRRTNSEQDAADVVAEVFTTAWRRLDSVPHGDEARLWLYGVARRVLANQRRAQRRRERLGERLALVRHPPVGDDDGGAAVGAVFRSMRPDDQEILALVAWEQLTTAEIAAVLGCSPNAARIRLHRARRRFADALGRGDQA